MPRLADAISRIAHNSERGPDTSAALPGSGPRPRPDQSRGEPLEGRGRERSLDQFQLGSADPAPGVHAGGRSTAQAHPASLSLACNLDRVWDVAWGLSVYVCVPFSSAINIRFILNVFALFLTSASLEPPDL